MPDFPPPLIDHRGRLFDFELVPGDARYAEAAGVRHGVRRRWGNRQLLAVQVDQNPNLGGLVAKTSATLIDTGDLGGSYPINVQVRFALVNPANGQPVLPITDLNPFVGGIGAPEIDLIFTIRRGVDPQAPVTQDRYLMPDIGRLSDAPPFDTITTRTLGVDVAISQHGLPSNPARLLSNLWVEAIAVVNDQVSVKDTLPGYTELMIEKFVPATATAPGVVLLRAHVARCQFFVQNTSKNADLILQFGGLSLPVSSTNGTMILPAGGANIYESPIGGWAGQVNGIWVGAPLDGGAFVTEGTQKSVFIP